MQQNDVPNNCAWCEGHVLLKKYHDEEWGKPIHADSKHFELLLLEAMSCGLSWLLMLKKRELFRACFAHFDYERVAQFGEKDVKRIIETEGMIRSRAKIESMVSNARHFMDIRKEFGSFDVYIWHFTNGQQQIYPENQTMPVVSNELSKKISKDLKKRGFKYLGPVILYSYLQAAGIINDHDIHCPHR